MLREMRFAFRRLRHNPLFSVTAILTLALSLGVTTAVFSVARGVLLAPLPFAEPENLVRVHNHPRGDRSITFEASYPAFLDWRRESSRFSDLAGYASTSGGLVVEVGDHQERLEGAIVSWNLFSVLGVSPIEGRLLLEQDDVSGAEPVMVIGEGLWRRRFGADPSLVGQRLRVGGEPRTVVGIVPASFEYPLGAEMWVPVAEALAPQLTESSTRFFNLVGRLAPGASLAAAESELGSIVETMTNPSLPESSQGEISLLPLEQDLLGDTKPPLLLLLAAGAIVLLIAAANLASLETVRAIAGQRSEAVRRALGAGAAHRLKAALADAGLLAFTGGVLSLLLAKSALPPLLNLAPKSFFRADQIAIDGWAVAGAGLAMVLLTLFLALGPRVILRAVPAAQALQRSAATSTGSRGSRRALSGFVVLQLAAALVLLLGAGVLMQSMMRLAAVDTGFSRSPTLTLAVPLLGETYSSATEVSQFYEELIADVRNLPGVTAAGGVVQRPLHSWQGYDYPYTAETQSQQEQQQNPLLNYLAVTAGYFEALEIPLLEGRSFTEADREESPLVAIISRSVAERHWPGQSALGQRLKWGGVESPPTWIEVVGVVPEGRLRTLDRVSQNVFVPHRQSSWPLAHLLVRAEGDPTPLLPAIRDRMMALDPQVQPLDVATTTELISAGLSRPRFQVLLLGIFASLSLVIAAIGLYGVLSYALTLRRREMALRLALGARPRGILTLALRHGFALVAVGITLGVCFGWFAAGALSSQLYETSARNPAAFVGLPLLLLVVALAAAYGPARRASRVEPAMVLKGE
ncbi:MAG: ADOP family duplicated permease [Deltaproteobacteria bacterium]|nr:ADOP family duplicated permease [Deltaproteobacteria bacterium]